MSFTLAENDEMSAFDKRVKTYQRVHAAGVIALFGLVFAYTFISNENIAGALVRLGFILASVILWGVVAFRFTPDYVLGDTDDERSRQKRAMADRMALRLIFGFLTTVFTIVTFWEIGAALFPWTPIRFLIEVDGFIDLNRFILPVCIGISMLPGFCLSLLLRPGNDKE